MTGIILELLKTVWTGKDTYLRDAYWLQLLIVLLSAQGVKAHSGAALLEKTDPCLSLTAIIATMTAKKRLLKTQKAAEGNFPLGTRSVGVNSVVMIFSCKYPHVKYDICKPQKQRANLMACLKNSGLLAIWLAIKPAGVLSFPRGTSRGKDFSLFSTVSTSSTMRGWKILDER